MKTPIGTDTFDAIYNHILSDPDRDRVSVAESDEGWLIFLSGNVGPHIVLLWADSKLTNILDAK